MTDDDPFVLLARPIDNWPPDADPLFDAVRRFDPANPVPLLKLFQSNDVLISGRGLFVFSYLGTKGAVVLDAALRLSVHPDKMARHYVVDGLMSYPELLSPGQARVVLEMVSDPFELVREKVIVFLAHANAQSLEAAIASLQEPMQSEHRNGFDVLYTEQANTQELFDEALRRADIWSAYAFASLCLGARKGAVAIAPCYAGADYVANGVVAHIKMHIKRHKMRRTGLRSIYLSPDD